MKTKILSFVSLALIVVGCQVDPAGPSLSDHKGTVQSSETNVAVRLSSPQLRRGWVRGRKGWNEASYLDYGTHAIYQDHILLSKQMYSNEEPPKNLDIAAFEFFYHQWPRAQGQANVEIPYELDANLNPEVRELAIQVFSDLNNNLPIRFRERRSGETNRMYVTHNPASFPASPDAMGTALIGFQQACVFSGQTCTNGFNELYLNPDPVIRKDPKYRMAIAHEIFHSLGALHEQDRNDKFNFIEFTSNLTSDGREIIAPSTREENYTITPFDIRSIMLYTPYLFPVSLDKSKPVIVRKGFTGRRATDMSRSNDVLPSVLSPGDRHGISYLYSDLGAPVMFGDVLDRETSIEMSSNSSQSISFDIADRDVSATTMRNSNCSSLLAAEIVQPAGRWSPLEAAIISNETGTPAQLISPDSETNDPLTGRKCKLTITTNALPGWGNVILKMFNSSAKTDQPSTRLIEIKVGAPSRPPQGISFKPETLSANENSPVRTFVGTLQSFDVDSGDDHLYSIESGTDSESFLVWNGKIQAARELTKRSYTLNIVSEDRDGKTVKGYAQIVRGPVEQLPVYAVSQTTRGESGTWVTLDANEGMNSTGAMKNYEWVFHDGTMGKSKLISKQFTKPGIYQVLLKATDEGGVLHTFAAEFEIPK